MSCFQTQTKQGSHAIWTNPLPWVVLFCLFCFRGWLERENQHEFKPSSIWYLVSISWWRIWKEHVKYQVGDECSTVLMSEREGEREGREGERAGGLSLFSNYKETGISQTYAGRSYNFIVYVCMVDPVRVFALQEVSACRRFLSNSLFCAHFFFFWISERENRRRKSEYLIQEFHFVTT